MVLKRYGKLLWAALLFWGQTGFADGGKVAESFDMPCPDGMSRSRLMTLSDAWRQTTPTRERISLNGLWEFHPVLTPDELEKIRDREPAGDGSKCREHGRRNRTAWRFI